MICTLFMFSRCIECRLRLKSMTYHLIVFINSEFVIFINFIFCDYALAASGMNALRIEICLMLKFQGKPKCECDSSSACATLLRPKEDVLALDILLTPSTKLYYLMYIFREKHRKHGSISQKHGIITHCVNWLCRTWRQHLMRKFKCKFRIYVPIFYSNYVKR